MSITKTPQILTLKNKENTHIFDFFQCEFRIHFNRGKQNKKIKPILLINYISAFKNILKLHVFQILGY